MSLGIPEMHSNHLATGLQPQLHIVKNGLFFFFFSKTVGSKKSREDLGGRRCSFCLLTFSVEDQNLACLLVTWWDDSMGAAAAHTAPEALRRY